MWWLRFLKQKFVPHLEPGRAPPRSPISAVRIPSSTLKLKSPFSFCLLQCVVITTHPTKKKTDPRFNRFSIYLLESFIFRVSICTFLIFTHITCHVFNFVVVFFLISCFCFGLVWGFCSVFLWFSFFTFVLLLSSFSLSDLAFPFEYSILLVQRCTNCFSRHSQNWVVRGVGRF